MSTPTREDQILAYGQKAVNQGGRAAGRSPVAAPKTPAKSTPPHILKAEKLWKQHFSQKQHMSAVKFHDLKQAPSCLIANSHFQAWTNTPNDVYVDASADGQAGMLITVLHHEMEHIVQFRTTGSGNRPNDYADMMKYEEEAYGKSAQYTKNHKSRAVRAFHAVMDHTHSLFDMEIAMVESIHSDRAARNSLYKKFLEMEQTPGDPTSVMLPTHQHLRDLYRKYTKCP